MSTPFNSRRYGIIAPAAATVLREYTQAVPGAAAFCLPSAGMEAAQHVSCWQAAWPARLQCSAYGSFAIAGICRFSRLQNVEARFQRLREGWQLAGTACARRTESAYNAAAAAQFQFDGIAVSDIVGMAVIPRIFLRGLPGRARSAVAVLPSSAGK